MAASSMPSFVAGEALEKLQSAEPPLFLSPSPELSASARAASRRLFSSLLPYCPKPPFDSLLTEDTFDAEHIWSQIDLLSRPILSVIRREIKRLECVELPVSAVEVKEVEAAEEEEEEMEEEGEEDDDDDEEEEEEGDGERNGVEDRFLKIKELEDYLEEDEAREYGLRRKGGGGRREAEGWQR